MIVKYKIVKWVEWTVLRNSIYNFLIYVKSNNVIIVFKELYFIRSAT